MLNDISLASANFIYKSQFIAPANGKLGIILTLLFWHLIFEQTVPQNIHL